MFSLWNSQHTYYTFAVALHGGSVDANKAGRVALACVATHRVGALAVGITVVDFLLTFHDIWYKITNNEITSLTYLT